MLYSNRPIICISKINEREYDDKFEYFPNNELIDLNVGFLTPGVIF